MGDTLSKMTNDEQEHHQHVEESEGHDMIFKGKEGRRE